MGGSLSDERAVSPVLGYVLTLSVATLLVGGLLVSAGGFIDDQRRNTAESELRVIGQQVSADISAADRLNRTAGAENITVGRNVPRTVVGSEYTIRVRYDGGGPTSPYLELSTVQPEVTVQVGIASKSTVNASTAHGGEIAVEVRCTPDCSPVVLRND